MLAAALVAAAGASERPPSAVPPPGVPALADLAARGATIGRIEVHVENIFDPRDAREDVALYRLANRLHVRTRERTVRTQLLIAPGERLDLGRLTESERLLRSRVYFNDAWIVPVAYDAASNSVDLAVTVRDVWTFNPNVALARSGGANQSRVGWQEENVAGLGSSLAVTRSHTVDRSSSEVSYADANAFGSFWQLALSYGDNSDGTSRAASLMRPFYALDTRHAYGASGSDTASELSRYSRGVLVDKVAEHDRQGQLYVGGSAGLVDGWVSRWFAGLRYDASGYGALAGVPLAAPAPAGRTLAYPYLGWQRLEDRYATAENLDLIGRTEDTYLGRALYAELGRSVPGLGATRASWPFQLTLQRGLAAGEQRYLFVAANASGRLEDGRVANLAAGASARAFARLTPRQLVYVALSANASVRPDGDQPLTLGGDNGLRGYPLRFQGGTGSALFTLEHRVYTDWYPFRLVRIGTVAFFDAGRTWGRDFAGAAPLGILRDVGLGLRLGNVRSGLGNVVHVDLAYALDAPAGTRDWQFLVSTQQRF